MTFASTYFLVLIGLSSYVLRVEQLSQFGFIAIAAGTGCVMAVYSLFLGWRKSYEERLITIPEKHSAVSVCDGDSSAIQSP